MSGTESERQILRDAPLLDSDLAAALDRSTDLAGVARVLADAAVIGRHRAGGRGGAAEFYDFRPYTNGDAPRLIDWRLAGRTNRLYLRRYRQEGRLSLVCVVDATASMDFGGIDRPKAVTKFRRARELAAALAYLAVKRGDAAGLVFARRGGTSALPARGGWPALHECVAQLERSACDPSREDTREQHAARRAVTTSSPLARAMDVAGTLLPRGGLVVVLTDGLDEVGPMLDAAGRLRFSRGSGATASVSTGFRDVAFVQILAREELALPSDLAATLVDPETNASTEFDARDAAGDYARTVEQHIESLRAGLRRVGARYILCRTESHAVDALRLVLGATPGG